LPTAWRAGISANSRQRTYNKDKDLPGYYDYAKIKIDSGFDAVIMGHTHFPEIKQWETVFISIPAIGLITSAMLP
jgi:predicted phosphodiesterase